MSTIHETTRRSQLVESLIIHKYKVRQTKRIEIQSTNFLYLLNPIRSGIFFLWLLRGGGGGADSAHHFETPVQASFAILTSFESIPLMTQGRWPRIQKMKCLAQKMTEWRRIEKL